MSYAALYWLPLEALACVVGGLLLALRRPLGAAVLGAVVSVALGVEKVWGRGPMPTLVPGNAGGVFGEHLVAAAVHERAGWAMGMLGWFVAPVLLCALGAALSASRRKRLLPLSLTAPAVAPTLVLLSYVAIGARYWRGDDPRWTLRYLDEWRAEGNPVNNGGPCWEFLALEAKVASVASAAELAAARGDCLRLCEGQAARRNFNPGSIEGECAAHRVEVAPR